MTRPTSIISASIFAIILAMPLSGGAQTPAAEPAPAAPPAEPAPAAPVPAPAPAAPAPAAPTTPAKLSGLAAWNAIIGNTVSGKREGSEYDYYVKADGTLVALDDGDIDTAKWALEGQNICVTFPDEDKECFTIELDGDIVSFRDSSGSGFRGTLHKGNPKKL